MHWFRRWLSIIRRIEYSGGHVLVTCPRNNSQKPSVRGPTAAFIFFDRKENEAKETLSITVARLMCGVEMMDGIE